jgi:glycosyltransferase involved in cell wall biosynthesis
MVLEAVVGRPDMSVKIAGTGPKPLVDALRDLAEHLGIASRVSWLGFIDSSRKSSFFADIDVVVMPSTYECFGLAAAEAICAGVPAVVSSRSGIARVVAEYEAGLVIEPTVGSLRRALESLRDPSLLRNLARNAGLAAREFDIDRHGVRLWEHYTRLTAENGAAREGVMR